MSQELKTYLMTALAKLESEFRSDCASKGYTEDTEQIRILIEMIKEQIGYEDTNS